MLPSATPPLNLSIICEWRNTTQLQQQRGSIFLQPYNTEVWRKIRWAESQDFSFASPTYCFCMWGALLTEAVCLWQAKLSLSVLTAVSFDEVGQQLGHSGAAPPSLSPCYQEQARLLQLPVEWGTDSGSNVRASRFYVKKSDSTPGCVPEGIALNPTVASNCHSMWTRHNRGESWDTHTAQRCQAEGNTGSVRLTFRVL